MAPTFSNEKIIKNQRNIVEILKSCSLEPMYKKTENKVSYGKGVWSSIYKDHLILKKDFFLTQSTV